MAQHVKSTQDKIDRDARWSNIKPRLRTYMSDCELNITSLADELGLSKHTVAKWFTPDVPTTPKAETLEEIECLLGEHRTQNGEHLA